MLVRFWAHPCRVLSAIRHFGVGLVGGRFGRGALFRDTNKSRLPISIKSDDGKSGGENANLICGFLGCDARPFSLLLSTLPRVIHVWRQESADGMLEQFVKLALSESSSKRAGDDAVLARLSELMNVEAVRRHLSALPPEQVGWPAGLRDDNIGRALSKLHDRPAYNWSLDDLAPDCR